MYAATYQNLPWETQACARTIPTRPVVEMTVRIVRGTTAQSCTHIYACRSFASVISGVPTPKHFKKHTQRDKRRAHCVKWCNHSSNCMYHTPVTNIWSRSPTSMEPGTLQCGLRSMFRNELKCSSTNNY